MFTVWVLHIDGTVGPVLTDATADDAATYADRLRSAGLGHTAVTVQPGSLTLADWTPQEFRALATATPR